MRRTHRVRTLEHWPRSSAKKSLSEIDRKFLKIANSFERKFVNQGFDENRSIEETLNIGWELLSDLSESEMKRIKPEFIEKYGGKKQ